MLSRNLPVKIGVETTWTAISAGFYHTVALKADGTLWAWGDDTKGQLGDGSAASSQSAPVKIGTDTNWTAVAAGDFHTLALKSDGSLWAWGDNSDFQVGNGAVVPGIQAVPVRIGTAADWVAFAAGGSHSLALKADHTLWGWGSNGSGQLGNGTGIDAVSPVQIVLAPPFVNTDWTAVAAGQSHSAALKSDGSLWSWGSNLFGRLGDGTSLNSPAPVRETGGATTWVAVSTSDFHTVGRRSDGSIWSWGGNSNGQLGNGTVTDAPAPVKVGAEVDWAEVDAGSIHTVALKSNGTFWSWGDNASGQLGDGTNIQKNSPVSVQDVLPPASGVTVAPEQSSPHTAGTAVIFTASGSGSSGYQYRFWLFNAAQSVWTMVQDYSTVPTWTMPANQPIGSYVVAVDVRTSSAVNRDAVAYLSYVISLPAATSVTITPDQLTPHSVGTPVVFTADAGAAGYQYRFWLYDGNSWALVQDYSVGTTWTLPASTPAGNYVVAVDARANSTTNRDTVAYLSFQISSTPATGVTITPSQNPHVTGDVIFTAAGTGSSGYQYRFWLYNGVAWTIVQDYGNGATWTMPAATTPGNYVVAVDVRTSAAVYRDAVSYLGYTF